MAEDNDSDDKSFDASPERIKQARKKGNVPQSPELLTLARYTGMLIAVFGIIAMLSKNAALRLVGFLNEPLGSTVYLFNGGTVLSTFGPVVMVLFGMVATSMVLAIVMLVAQQAITFAPTKLKPDLSKLSLIKNAGNKFGPAGLIDFMKGMVKVLAVITMGVLIVLGRLPNMLSSVGAPPAMLAGEMRALLAQLLIGAVILAILAAAIDVPLKWSQHAKKLKMSRQELVDEAKEIDGNPEQKQARQAQARSIAQNRQLQDVLEADVVVVNPEHYAVALKWDRDAGEVPRCVAKGIDHMALLIRQKAEGAKVPIHRDVPTARAIYAGVEVGEEVQREQYEAVAAAIRFADALRAKRKLM